MKTFITVISNLLPIIFAMLLIFFIINYDWSKSKVKKWIPYLFIVFLFFFIIHNFLKFIGINVVEQLLDEDIRNTFFEHIRNPKQ